MALESPILGGVGGRQGPREPAGGPAQLDAVRKAEKLLFGVKSKLISPR